MNSANPQFVAAVFGFAGTVLGATISVVSSIWAEGRRANREAKRDAATAARERRALTFDHRRQAAVEFAQTVSKWALSISNADTMNQWPGADFDTFDPVAGQLELVQLYGTREVSHEAEQLFKALSDYGWSTGPDNWRALVAAQERYREAIRTDLEVDGLPSE